ncbi:MAG: DUF1501 domain-containing protein [Lentisphaeraceae bacterium]|nr:DUF1501 domain-containing protein [Lentisphaeraceae bacterium]
MNFLSNRRDFFKYTSAAALGFKGMNVFAADTDHVQKPHHTARAKSVIFLNMRGAPSHLDTFDYKPDLAKNNGKRGKYGNNLLEPITKFSKSGKSGLWLSDYFPNLQKQADDLCLLKGMYSAQPNHPQAQTLMHTGNFQFARPSLGAWVLYGLGSENKDIPGFISLNPAPNTSQHYGSSFLPTEFQGSAIGKLSRGGGRGSSVTSATLPDIDNQYISKDLQRKQVDFVQMLNKGKKNRDRYSPETAGVAESYEMAYRMQFSMPEIMDYENEKSSTKKMYGLEDTNTAAFGTQLLLARRFVEAGARFIEISQGNWDHHFNMKTVLPQSCGEIDLPIAGLLKDLKQRGLLKNTLVVWSGEFGRTPEGQGTNGRNHNNKGYTSWMAGGGVKGGYNYGSTDELGYEAVEGRMSTQDWHATILHLLGINHEKLTYNYAGRDFRLTDVYGDVAKEILS